MLVSLQAFINKFDDLFLPVSSTQHNTNELIIVWSSLSFKQHDEEPDKNATEKI